MFQLLYDLGKTIAKIDSRSEIYDLLKDPIPDEYGNLVEIQFDDSGRFVSVTSRKIDRNEKNYLLYKKGPPNGFDATALSKFAEDPAKTTDRVRKSVSAIANNLHGTVCDLITQLTTVAAELDRKHDDIAAQVKSAVDILQLDVTNRGLLTASVKRGNTFVLVCQIPEVGNRTPAPVALVG